MTVSADACGERRRRRVVFDSFGGGIENALHFDERHAQRALRTEVLRPPVWQDRRGSIDGGDVVEVPQLMLAESGILDREVKVTMVAFADEPTPEAGNRRGCWCIQPIGY